MNQSGIPSRDEEGTQFSGAEGKARGERRQNPGEVANPWVPPRYEEQVRRRRLVLRVKWRDPVGVLVLVFFPLAFLFVYLAWQIDFFGQARYEALAARGISVKGTVLRTDPGDHNAVYYSFRAGGMVAQGSSASESPNPTSEKLKAGDSVHVVYDPLNPSVSCACDPKQFVGPGGSGTVVILCIFAAFAVAVVATVQLGRAREWWALVSR